MGIGGGFLLTIYTKSSNTSETLNARETAPAAATENMFVNVSQVTGPLSVGIPSEIKGYWELHKKYGSLPWKTIFQPSIDLCRNGFSISWFLAKIMQKHEASVRNSAGLTHLLINPKTNMLRQEGEIIKRPELAKTLELIANGGADEFYSGTIAKSLVRELQSIGGIITEKDMQDYDIRWEPSLQANIFKDHTLHSTPLPGSGNILIMILNILNGYLPAEESPLYHHRIVESLKFGFAKRTELADPYFVPEAKAVIYFHISFLLNTNSFYCFVLRKASRING